MLTSPAHHRSPVVALAAAGHGRVGGAAERLRRAESLREAAVSAESAAERFLLAYQSARAAGASLLGPAPRRGRNNVWIRLEKEWPLLAEWATAFSGYSRLASSIDAGLPREIEEGFAAEFLWAVGCFLTRVEAELVSGSAAA